MSASAQVITTVAGNGAASFCGDGGLATSACLNAPDEVGVDATGNLSIADTRNHRIRSVDAATGIITTVAGSGPPGFCGDGGPATSACLNAPYGVAVDATGNLWIADTLNHRIRSIDAATGIITTVAGCAIQGFSGDGGPATSACLNYPFGVAVDATGNLLIVDWGNNRIRRVDVVTGIITTVAGNGTLLFCGDGGPATSACLSPIGVAVDASGNLLIADPGNSRIRRVDATTGIITTVAGSGPPGFCGDGGPATSACLSPTGVAVDASGNLLIADSANYRIRRVDATTGIITTVAGSDIRGFCGDGGPATSACLLNPFRVAVDATGNLFIADSGNHRIRRVDAATSSSPRK